MHGDFPMKVHSSLIGLKVYGWLQRKAGWDEREPPVQVYKNSQYLAPKDWSDSLKRRHGHNVTS